MSLLFTEKPYDWPTHRVDTDKLGYVEHLEEELNQKLYVSHRLDKTTTGAMVFATTQESAKTLQTYFTNKQIQKEYYFITDRNSESAEYTISSHIEEKDKVFTSHNNKEANSSTVFTWVRAHKEFNLWKASPISGKTHQIRLHAKDAKIPILGDNKYGGSSYPFLLLHSHTIKIPDIDTHESPLPPYFADLKLLENPLLCRSVRAIEDRSILFKNTPNCIRWVHKEVPWLCVDQLGDHLWFQIFEDTNNYGPLISDIKNYLETKQNTKLAHHIQIMPNRGMKPNQKLVNDFGETRWTSYEHKVAYEFRSDSGSSYGLFLDQRQNRKWILDNSKDKSLLNLFCYTGGFSLCALKAGAKEVVSVDTSKATLDWLNRNIEINSFDNKKHKSWSTDARIFLKGAIQKQKSFDLIICDPPSFSRSKEGIFKIENDFKDLLERCLHALAPKGTLLFSTNYEGWQMQDFKEQVELAVPKGFKIERYTSSGADYEPPTQSRILKMVFISKL